MGLIISADEHIVEPDEFWSQWLPDSLPAAERDLAPRIKDGALMVDGQVLPVFKLFPQLIDFSNSQPGVGDVEGRLAMMDEEGIDQTILFPQRAMGMYMVKDPEFRIRCFDAFNAWVADLCRRSGGRLHAVAVLPTVYDTQHTAACLMRIKDLGFRMFMIPGNIRGKLYGSDEMRPFWQAIADSGLITCFHTSETPDDNGPGGLGTFLMQTTQPFRKLWGHLVFSGILERHAGVKVMFAEGGISWVPSALDQADRLYESFAPWLDPKLPMKPSDYWRRQCFATFMEDPPGLDQIDRIGAEHALWSSDYPHPEGTRGRSRALAAEIRAQLGDARADAILGGNAERLLAA